MGRSGRPKCQIHPKCRDQVDYGKVHLMITDGHKDGIGFTWLDWSPALLTLHKGVNIYYIAGRSVGFGIDRIILYRTNDELAKENATKL